MSRGRVHRGLVASGLMVAGLAGLAQQRSVPAGANAAISGAVMSGDSQSVPMRRAIVTISSDALTYARSAITDDAGRFEFVRLPAGTYTISAKKAAYLVAEFGSMKPGLTGSRLALAAGERRGITLTMFRGAAVGGALMGANGKPLVGVSVSALKTRTLRDNDRPDPEPVVTNDRGEYRIYGLTPGEYFVVALPNDDGAGEIGARSAADMDALLALVAQRQSPVAAATRPATTADPLPAPRLVGYSPIYFPGTPLLADAEPIRLAAGDDRSTIGFSVPRVPVAAIEGTISGDVTNPAGVQVAIIPEVGRLRLRGKFPQVTALPPNDAGEFKYGNLSPGRYQIVARARAAGSSNDQLYASADVEVRGQDIRGLALRLQPGGVIAGRVVFDSARTPIPANPASIRVGVSILGGGYAYQVSGLRIGNILSDVPLSAVGADSTFRISGLGPSRYTLTTTLPPDLATIWKLRSAIVDGRDLLDADINGFGIDLHDVLMTFSDKRTELTGALLSESGQPASQYYVIAFSADRAQWRPGSRRTVSVRPATDGRFVFSDLPAGDYLIAALTDLDPDQWQESAFLEQVAPAAIPLRIAEGEKKQQDLRIK